MRYVLKVFLLIFFPLTLSCAPPLISIVTSVYKGEKFIRSFLENIVQQTIFDTCELIIINANSPENEEPVILEFAQKYPNILYTKLSYDPGLYGVWNLAIDQARGQFITNANLDDRVAPHCYETYLSVLQTRADIDLVYSDFYVTRTPPSWIYSNFPQDKITGTFPVQDFSFERLKRCSFVGPQPMWRKSLHRRCGLFNMAYKIAGDWEMWLRAAACGAKFLRIPVALGIYFENPDGLSVSKKNTQLLCKENKTIQGQYWNRKVMPVVRA